MNLKDVLSSKIIVSDNQGSPVFCGRLNDPGVYTALLPHLKKTVKSMTTSGTYCLIMIEREVAS